MFIGREKEKEALTKILDSSKQEVALIYGRRRMGKSELIHECCKKLDCKIVYYQCREVTEKQNIDSISDILQDVFNIKGVSFKTIDDIFSYVFNEAKKEKIVFVLDEYPYLRKQIVGLDSIIQSYIDRYAKETKLKLILCGSYVEIMKSLLEDENPLYGRFTLIINLISMNYKDASKFYKRFSKQDKVALYSIFGGVPYYCSLINENISVKDNIIDLIIKPYGILRNEVANFLYREISKIENGASVFDAIANGKVKFSDIFNDTGMSTDSALNNTLNKFYEMEVIDKEFPINTPNDKKKSIYKIKDNLIHFYYKYIFRNEAKTQIMDSNVFYETYIADDLINKFIPKKFEDICKQFLIIKNMKNEINPLIEKIGKYYYNLPKERKNGEFDIVSEDKNGFIFYEAKYLNHSLKDEDILKEINQVNASPLHAYKYGFFSKNGYNLKENYNQCIFYDLNDLFK